MKNDYITEANAKDYTDETVFKHVQSAKKLINMVSERDFKLINDIFFNHVAVPGLVNPIDFDQTVASNQSNKDRPAPKGDPKLQQKFKNRRGQFNSLPDWVANFDNEIRVSVENLQESIKVQETKLLEFTEQKK